MGGIVSKKKPQQQAPAPVATQAPIQQAPQKVAAPEPPKQEVREESPTKKKVINEIRKENEPVLSPDELRAQSSEQFVAYFKQYFEEITARESHITDASKTNSVATTALGAWLNAITNIGKDILIAADNFGTVHKIDVSTGEVLKAQNTELKYVKEMVKADNERVVIGAEYAVGVFNVNTMSLESIMPATLGPGFHRSMIPFGKNANFVFYCDNDHSVVLVDTNSRTVIKTYEGHTNYVTVIEALPDGKLASGSCDESIKIWDVASGNLLETWTDPRNTQEHPYSRHIFSLRVINDHTLASGSNDGIINLWDVLTGTVTKQLSLQSDEKVIFDICLISLNHIAVAHSGECFVVFDTESGATLGSIPHKDSVRCLAYIDQNRIASCQRDGEINIWKWQ